MEQLDKEGKTVRKLKKQLKLYVKRVEELEGNYYMECFVIFS